MFNRGNNNLILHWAKTGKAQQLALYPWISTDWTSFASGFGGAPGVPAGSVGNMLGSTWFDDFGNTFALKMQRGANAVLGNVLNWSYPGTGGIAAPAGADTATAASTTTVVTATTGGFTAGQEVGNWLFCLNIGNGTTGTTKTDVIKQIKANSANTFTISKLDTKYGNNVPDPDAYVTAPANTNNINVIRPFDVTLMQAAADNAKCLPVGIAAQAITQNTLGFTQVAGLAVVFSSVTALITAQQGVINDALVNGAAKGAGASWTAGSWGVGAAVGSATAGALTPVWLTGISTNA